MEGHGPLSTGCATYMLLTTWPPSADFASESAPRFCSRIANERAGTGRHAALLAVSDRVIPDRTGQNGLRPESPGPADRRLNPQLFRACGFQIPPQAQRHHGVTAHQRSRGRLHEVTASRTSSGGRLTGRSAVAVGIGLAVDAARRRRIECSPPLGNSLGHCGASLKRSTAFAAMDGAMSSASYSTLVFRGSSRRRTWSAAGLATSGVPEFVDAEAMHDLSATADVGPCLAPASEPGGGLVGVDVEHLDDVAAESPNRASPRVERVEPFVVVLVDLVGRTMTTSMSLRVSALRRANEQSEDDHAGWWVGSARASRPISSGRRRRTGRVPAVPGGDVFGDDPEERSWRHFAAPRRRGRRAPGAAAGLGLAGSRRACAIDRRFKLGRGLGEHGEHPP